MRVAVLALLAAILSLALSPAAFAVDYGTYAVEEFPLPAGAAGIGAMALDRDGNVWLIQDSPPVLYKLSQESQTFSRYALRDFEGAAFAGMSVDEEGIVWFADPRGNRFGAYTEAANHTAVFNFPGPMAPTSVVRRGNYVWLGCKEELGEYDLVTREFYDHFVQHMDEYLYDIHFDRVGNIWFVANGWNRVGAYFRTYDKVVEFDVPTPDSGPICLAIDDEGRLWFVESVVNKLGMFDTGAFSFAEHEAPTVDGKKAVFSRVAAAGDSVWLTDVKNGRALKFYPGEGRFAAAGLDPGAMPTLIEPGPDGSLWIYEASAKKLLRLNEKEGFGFPTPTPTPEPIPTPVPSPTPMPQPTKAPGLTLIVGVAALFSALYIKRS